MPALLFTAFVLSSSTLFAQEDSCLERTVPVSVSTEYAVPIDGLRPDNFVASFRGDRVPVISATRNTVGPRVIVLIDASGSMLGNKKWNSSLNVARELVLDAPSSSQLGLALFNDRLGENVPPTPDREAMLAELGRLASAREVSARGHGLTALWDSVDAVANDFQTPQVGDSIYILSDGEDNRSSISINSAKSHLLQRGIRAFFFDAEVPDGGPIPEERAGPSAMQEIADSTGGSVIVTSSEFATPGSKGMTPVQREATSAFVAQEHDLFFYYEVELKMSSPVDKVRGWKLETKGLTDRHAQVLYPHFLAPCRVQNPASGPKP